MAQKVRPFTSQIPLHLNTVVLFDPGEGEAVFANTVDAKMDLLLDAELPFYVAWPGTFNTHVFEIKTTADRREAIKALAQQGRVGR